jgi:hypothetical protein
MLDELYIWAEAIICAALTMAAIFAAWGTLLSLYCFMFHEMKHIPFITVGYLLTVLMDGIRAGLMTVAYGFVEIGVLVRNYIIRPVLDFKVYRVPTRLI